MADNFDFLQDAIWQIRDIQVLQPVPRFSFLKWNDPHIHYYWEIKIFTDTRRAILIPPEVTHPSTIQTESTNLKVLSLSTPLISLTSGWEHSQELFIPFFAVDSLCPGGVAEFCAKIQASSQNSSNALLTQSMMQLLLHIIGTAKTKEGNLVVPAKSPTVKARNYIVRYYYRCDLTIKEVAEHVGVLPGHLANMFQKERLGTVRQYLINTRLENALKLLQSGHYSVKEASMLSGWNSPFYFSNTFYRYFKKRPSDVYDKEGMSCQV